MDAKVNEKLSADQGRQLARMAAFHEAGHAVAFRHHRFYVDNVTLDCTYFVYNLADVKVTPYRAARYRDIIVCTYAGGIAQRAIDSTPAGNFDEELEKTGFSISDLDIIKHCLECLYGQNYNAKQVEKFQVRAARLIIAHWQKIEAVASALLNRESLSSFELDELLLPR